MTRWWLAPGGAYLTVLLILLGVSWQTTTRLGYVGPKVTPPTPGGDEAYSFTGASILGGWAHWDAGWYYVIATHGYEGHTPGMVSPVAFFPGYPLLMGLAGRVVDNPMLAGVFLTIACGLAAAVLFWDWCRRCLSAPGSSATTPTTALAVLLLYPYSYYLYGVVYADALFLASTLAAFTALERDRPALAGLLGAVAAFSRPVGIAVVVGLTIRALERRGALALPSRASLGRALRSLRSRDGLVLISATGFVVYAGFLWARFGNPLLFSSVQKYWDQGMGLRTWFKIELFQRLIEEPGMVYTWGITVQAVLTLTACAVVPLVIRRLGWGYGTYVAVVLAMPVIGSKDFQGLGRYLLAAFPLFALAGHELARRDPLARVGALAVSGAGLLVMTVLFATGRYLA